MIKTVLAKIVKFSRMNFGILIICLSSFTLLLYRAKELMTGPHSFCNAFNAIMAQNYHDYGFLYSKFEPLIYNLAPYLQSFYLNHPPLFFILVGVIFKITASLFFVRIVIILFSVLAIYLYYVLVSNITQNKKIAISSAIFMGFSPMLLYYGKLINFEAVVLCLIIASCLLLASLKKNFSNHKLLALAFLLFVSALFDWPVTFLALIVSSYGLFFFKSKERLKIISISVIPIVADIAFVLYEKKFFGLTSLLGAGKMRMTYDILLSIDFWKVIETRCVTLFTPVVAVLSFLFVLSIFYKTVKGKKIKELLFNEQIYWVVAFFYLGLINILVFPYGAQIHEFWLYYFLPFFSLTAGIMISKIKEEIIILSIFVLFLFSSVIAYKDIYEWSSYQQAGIDNVVGYLNTNKIGKEYLFIGPPVLAYEVTNKTNVNGAYWSSFIVDLEKFKILKKEKEYAGVYFSYDFLETRESFNKNIVDTFGSGNFNIEYLDNERMVKVNFLGMQ